MSHRNIASLAAALALAACGDGAKRPLGSNCSDDSQCASGLCVESVCLDPEGDEDRDGLTNGVEGALGTNPFLPDTDADGKLDPLEIDMVQLVNRDTDGDGQSDATESAIADADADCLVDELDPANTVPDPEGCGSHIGSGSCSAIFESGVAGASGSYTIDPDGEGPEAGIAVECLMGVANGGWTRLTAAWNAWLARAPIAPTPQREYLYLAPTGTWYRTAVTVAPWSWSVPAAAPGVWFLQTGDGTYDSIDCPGGSTIGVGFGCGTGPTLSAVPGGDESGTASLCLGGACTDGVAVYMRDKPCAGSEGNLLGDSGFDAFANGQPSCWRIPLAQPPDRPGAGVSADDAGAREGHAPALRADRFDVQGVWLTHLQYESVAVSSHHGYRFSFWARAATPRPLFVLGGAGTGQQSSILSLTDTWRPYELGFVPSDTQLDALPSIMFGQLDTQASVWIDDVALVDVGPLGCAPPEGELLGDPGFTGGTACWIPVPWSEQQSGRFSSDYGEAPIPSDMPSLRVDHDLEGARTGPQLAQITSAYTVGGHGYELGFDAKGPRETLLVRLSTWRAGNFPTESEHPLSDVWSHVVLRWDTSLDIPDTTGAVVTFEPSGPGPGTYWLDNAHLVDLGADPCQAGIWTTRGFVPDGGFDFGLRCWTVSAGAGTRVEADDNPAWAGDAVPALYTVNGGSPEYIDVASTPFDLPPGNYVLTLGTRMTGQRSLEITVVDASGQNLAFLPVSVRDAWSTQELPFDIKDATRVTLHLRTNGIEIGEIWVDGLAVTGR